MVFVKRTRSGDWGSCGCCAALILTVLICQVVGPIQARQRQDPGQDALFWKPSHEGKRYEPNWESIDSRPLPAWYDEAKIGMFISWGIYAVPGVDTEWFWYHWKSMHNQGDINFMKNNFPPDFDYTDFAVQFKAEFFNPNQWADILQASGVKYVVQIAKYCDGYTTWPSKYSFIWNSVATGPKRDLIGELSAAIRNRTDLKYGIYHSLYDWYHPLYLYDLANNYTTNEYIKAKALPALYEVVNEYKPEIIWSDGDWMVDDWYWNSTVFLAWLYNDSPVKDTVVVNDRWGKNARCHHGGFWNCDDKFNPGKLIKHKWENSMPIDKGSWGFRRVARLDDYLTIHEIIALIAEVVSCGGNLFLNVGPTADGRIIPVYEERLRQMGSWLKVNGEAIYASHPWSHQNDTITKGVWYTMKKTQAGCDVFAILLFWPTDGALFLGAPRSSAHTEISLLGYSGQPFPFKPRAAGGVDITVPAIPINQMPCDWGWVLRMTYLTN